MPTCPSCEGTFRHIEYHMPTCTGKKLSKKIDAPEVEKTIVRNGRRQRRARV